MKQITYDPTRAIVDRINSELKKKLEALYIGQPITDTLTKAIYDTTRDYMVFGDAIPWTHVNLNVNLSDGSGDSIWKRKP